MSANVRAAKSEQHHYGIRTSRAHFWIHVCPLDHAVYWYSRRRMVEALDKLEGLPEVAIRSAVGVLFPIEPYLYQSAGGFVHAAFPMWRYWLEWQDVENASDRQAGEFAERLIERAFQDMVIGIPGRVRRYDAKRDQFRGMDYQLEPYLPSVDFEIKCDGPGGLKGTGNLFVQTHERDHDATGRNSHRRT